MSHQKLIIHDNPHVMLIRTCISGAKTQSNRWKLPLIDPRTLVVYGGSVGCGIVTTRKYLLWRRFDRLPTVVKLIIVR